MLVPADFPTYGTFSLHRRQKEFLYSVQGRQSQIWNKGESILIPYSVQLLILKTFTGNSMAVRCSNNVNHACKFHKVKILPRNSSALFTCKTLAPTAYITAVHGSRGKRQLCKLKLPNSNIYNWMKQVACFIPRTEDALLLYIMHINGMFIHAQFSMLPNVHELITPVNRHHFRSQKVNADTSNRLSPNPLPSTLQTELLL
jgi:hypothetical protein